jgi:hypothetical protein
MPLSQLFNRARTVLLISNPDDPVHRSALSYETFGAATSNSSFPNL